MIRPVLALAVSALVLSACGQAAPAQPVRQPADGGADTVAPVCAPDVPDCEEMIVEPVRDDRMLRQGARDLLGLREDELPPGVRVSRRGDEHMMLTEDYVVGRMTVELDAAKNDQFRVVAVVVELEDGPKTITQ